MLHSSATAALLTLAVPSHVEHNVGEAVRALDIQCARPNVDRHSQGRSPLRDRVTHHNRTGRVPSVRH